MADNVTYPNSTAGAAFNGHLCPACGAFVPSGTMHTCHKDFLPPSNPLDQYAVQQQRIANALERIASALEKLAEDDGG